MTKRILPTPEQLRELLRYEPETGKLFWKERPREACATNRSFGIWKSRFAGKEALACIDEGYKTGFMFSSKQRAHRVAWAIYYGQWPKDQIDHINQDRSDNRISNLREAANCQNQWNISVRSSSRTGLKGVGFRNGKYLARICVEGNRIFLGYFPTKESAHAAYCNAAEKYHGKFARKN